MVEPEWLLKATQGDTTSMNAAPRCSIAALINGTSCCLSPEKLRATKVAPSSSARLTMSIGSSLLATPRLDFEPLSAVAENWPLVSPCVAFNNHPGSTKSYDYVREHNEAVNRIDFFHHREEITTDYAPGSVQEVVQHDGSVLRLRKLHDDYDAHDRIGAMNYLQEHHAKGEVVTGLLFVDPEPDDLHSHLNTAEVPLNTLNRPALCPGAAALDKINASLR